MGTNNITFGWTKPTPPYDGISVLVNDVERYRWYEGEGVDSFIWERRDKVEREYFRFGYMTGSGTGDYTKAGVWEIDGSWTKMKPGPS